MAVNANANANAGTAGIYKLRAASCSVLLLLLTLALVASSLLVARYAVQASSWWLSLLAVTVCLLGLCTWIQLAASRAGRWRALLARQIALSRAHAAHAAHAHPHGLAGSDGPDFCRAGSCGDSRCSTRLGVYTISLDCGPDCQAVYRVPRPPPPYALPEQPPGYSSPASGVRLPPPESTPEQPPPYSVAVKRDSLVEERRADAVPAATDVAPNPATHRPIMGF